MPIDNGYLVMPDPGVEEWKAHTSAFDRVRAVSTTVSKPRSAAWIATEAAVPIEAAYESAKRLVEQDVLLTVEEGPETRFYPNPEHDRRQTRDSLLAEFDLDVLEALKEELTDLIDTWRRRYEVDASEDLRTLASRVETPEEQRTVRKAAREWELAQYRIHLVDDAIDHYDG